LRKQAGAQQEKSHTGKEIFFHVILLRTIERYESNK
jgi:hypothetical protein